MAVIFYIFYIFLWSFKITNFGTNGKPIYDFLCVNRSKLLPVILHHFGDMADRWSNFCP